MSSNQHGYQTFDSPFQDSQFDAQSFGAEPAFAQRKQGSGCCCCSGCCLGCLGLILLAVLALGFIGYCFFSGGAPLIVSPETTIITEPLKSDGKTVDFHQAIQRMVEPNLRADENGFRDVVIGYGREVFEGGFSDADRQYHAMCERLGIDPLTPPKFSLKNFDQPENIYNAGLDAIQAAAAQPHYFIPMVRQNERDLVIASQLLGVYAFHRAATSALQQRAMSRFDSEDTAGAWKDILTTIRLFRSVTVNRAWSGIMRTSGRPDREEELLLTSVADVVDTLPKWEVEQLTQAIKDLESLPNWQDRQTTLTIMQFAVLDALSIADDLPELVRRLTGNKLSDDLLMLQALDAIGFDMNLLAKELNSHVKRYEEDLKQSAQSDLDKQFELLRMRGADEPRNRAMNEEETRRMLEDHFRANPSLNPFFASGRSHLFGVIAGEIVTDAAGEMYRLQIMEESRCQALRWALALERYYRQEQKYPDSLEELGVQPMTPNMYLEYETRGAGYRIQNKVFRLDKR